MGKDWRWDELTQTLELLPGSRIPYFEPADLRGEGLTPVPGAPNGFDQLKRAQIGQCLYCEGPFFWEKALYITYSYEPREWKGYNESYKPSLLPKTLKRLTEKEKIKFVKNSDVSLLCKSVMFYKAGKNMMDVHQTMMIGNSMVTCYSGTNHYNVP